MNNQNRKNYAIPRIDRENIRLSDCVLLNKKDDRWYWVLPQRSKDTYIVTADNIYDAFDALIMEINDK